MKKLQLKKKVISILTNEEQQNIIGGNDGTTSYTKCTGFACCSPEVCVDNTMGYQASCARGRCTTVPAPIN